jgi:hypothetical protein
MWIRLTRKLADFLDGIDVSDRREGDRFELSTFEAQLLIAEGWAQALIPDLRTGHFGTVKDSPAGDEPHRSDSDTLERLRQLREQMDRRSFAAQDRRRVEDRIREELHDCRAKTIRPRRRSSS